jgi:hypothetical protein
MGDRDQGLVNAKLAILQVDVRRRTWLANLVKRVQPATKKLEEHIKVSRRLLNDLRTLRRLLLDERVELVGSKHGIDPAR